MKTWSEFLTLRERCWPGYKSVPGKKAYSPGSCKKESIDVELKEDLRKWFSKTDPAGDWKRINSKGEAIGPCAREPGEPKPKCMSRAKRESLTKKERASAVAAKRKHDPNPERKGEPINVSNFGKGKISENMENLNEKNVPTNPELWSRAKSLARSKFDVYPSAYANGWASKWYKGKGGSWKSVSEDVESLEEGRPSQRHPLEGHEYHKKSNAELEYIAKDAHKAAEAMKSHNTTAENKYRDQANDSATVRHFRKTSGMPDWYKKKYGHIKEDAKQDDKSSTALSGLVAKKNLKQTEGKNKSQAFIDKMTSKVNAAKRLKEEDAYDKDAKPSDKPHDKEAAAKRAKIAAVMARRKMAKEEVEQIDELSTGKYNDYMKASKTQVDSHKQGNDDSRYRYSNAAGKMQDRESNTKKAQKFVAKKIGVSEESVQIDELSNDMLGRYKTAAGADASKADKAGDYNKGNKRFSGIMKATKKQMANDIITRASSVTEAKEKTEYDYEGDMARGQLQSIINNAQRVHDMLEDNDNLPEWVQSKITLAEDYVSTVANYLMSEIDEQVEQIAEREDDEYNSVRDHKVGVVVSKDNGPKERLKATMRAKEPQQAVNAALKHYKSKGYTVHEHKYLGEAIADDKYGSPASETLVTKPHKELIKKMKESKDNSPPFDGPYTKDKGTVTDKSGAKHTPMSRARNLARQAMKKQSDSLKAPSRLGEESSRKAEIVKAAVKKKKMNSKEDTFQSEPEISTTITKNY